MKKSAPFSRWLYAVEYASMVFRASTTTPGRPQPSYRRITSTCFSTGWKKPAVSSVQKVICVVATKGCRVQSHSELSPGPRSVGYVLTICVRFEAGLMYELASTKW